MRTPFDRFAKQLICGALTPAGSPKTDAEITHDTQRADVLFTPDPARRAALTAVGLLGRLATGVCLFEPFHRTPDARALRGCLRKLLAFEHEAALRGPAPSGLLSDVEAMLWVLSAGRPTAAMRELGFKAARGYPRGVYTTVPGLRLGIVVLSELPATRDTLLLRLMGAGKTLKRAVAELARLPEDALERALALPILVQLRLEVPAEPTNRTSEDAEFIMSTHDVVEAWKQQWIEQGAEQGTVRTLMDVYEARFGAMPDELRAALESSHDEAKLRGLAKLFTVRPAGEIAEALLKTS
jgi:hypothetical protein